MTIMTGTGQDRRQASGTAWSTTSVRASHSGCSWDRYGSREKTLMAASATAERAVLDPFLAARRKRRHPGHQPLR